MQNAVEKGSGIIAIACLLLGLLLIIAAVRGTYVSVWKAFTGSASGSGNGSQIGTIGGGIAGGVGAIAGGIGQVH